jgi:UPF0755 protein
MSESLPEEHPLEELDHNKKSNFKFYLKLFILIDLLIIGAVLIAALSLFQLNKPAADFPENEPIVIAPGTPVRTITEELKAKGVVRSEQLLYYILVFLHNPADLKASTYVFDTPLTALDIAKKLTEGDFDTDLVRFTHIEGERVEILTQRAEIFFPNFNAEQFTQNALPMEGRLFPETYFVPPTYDDTELLKLLIDTYEEKVEPLRKEIDESLLTEQEVIILASILEREANSPESMSMVSGILQNRLAIDMPLQADATIEYVLENPLGELPAGQLASELRELDSPYNSYLNLGLPPTPIGNPGLDAIVAAINPTPSDYFYYITGDDGEFYYAETYNQHLQNIALYLR